MAITQNKKKESKNLDPYAPHHNYDDKYWKFQKNLLRNGGGVALTKLSQVAIRFSCYLAY